MRFIKRARSVPLIPFSSTRISDTLCQEIRNWLRSCKLLCDLLPTSLSDLSCCPEQSSATATDPRLRLLRIVDKNRRLLLRLNLSPIKLIRLTQDHNPIRLLHHYPRAGRGIWVVRFLIPSLFRAGSLSSFRIQLPMERSSTHSMRRRVRPYGDLQPWGNL